MTTEEEPKEQDPSELFPAFEILSQIGREVGDPEARVAFIESVVSGGEITEESLALSNSYIESVKADSHGAVETTVDPDLKHALQIREQILHQVALIILLLDSMGSAEEASNDALADELFGEAMNRVAEFATEMENVLADENLSQREYFEAVREKIRRMLG